MIEVLIALGVSLLLGASAGLFVRHRRPKGASQQRSPPVLGPPRAPPSFAGTFRVVSAPNPSARPSLVQAPIALRSVSPARSVRASRTVFGPPASPFQLTRRAVAPDASCFVCGRLLRECDGHGA